jgi:paraquat-inducible protein B
MLEAVNMEELNRSVVASAQSVERLADSDEVRAAFAEVPAMSAQINRTLGEIELLVDRLGGAVDPLQSQLAGTHAELILTLQSMRQVIDESRGMLTPDSGIGYHMEGAMISLRGAADALRDLALSLERNPDMLIRGRRTDED